MYLERRIGTKNIVIIILLEILKFVYSDNGKKVKCKMLYIKWCKNGCIR